MPAVKLIALPLGADTTPEHCGSCRGVIYGASIDFCGRFGKELAQEETGAKHFQRLPECVAAEAE